jgi:hypothetical protein
MRVYGLKTTEDGKYIWAYSAGGFWNKKKDSSYE